MLANTAITDASKVDAIYKITTVLIVPPCDSPPFDIALITRQNTRMGAIPLRAPTKMFPSIAIPVHCGTVRPSTAPIARPHTILRTKLVSCHFFYNAFIIFSFS